MIRILAALFQQIAQVTQSLILMQDTIITLCKTDHNNNNNRKIKLANLATALE